MPPGIWTVERRDSEHREDGVRGGDTGQVRGASGRGDDYFDATAFRAGDKLGCRMRGAMGGENALFMGDAEPRENVAAMLHDVPVGFTAHNDGDHALVSYWPWARVKPALPS
jgi:hypothetical protein